VWLSVGGSRLRDFRDYVFKNEEEEEERNDSGTGRSIKMYRIQLN